MASISGGENQDLLWGWERFFEELTTFMEDSDRQASTAERLQIAIVSVSAVLNHLQTTPPSDDQQAQLGDYFVFELSALLQCLRDFSVMAIASRPVPSTCHFLCCTNHQHTCHTNAPWKTKI